MALLTLAGPVEAIIPNLNTANSIQAKLDGEAMNTRESGYVLGTYLLKAYNQDVILRPNSPEIDGVVLGTPYERLRYEAYLSHLEGKPITGARVGTMARTLADKLTFRVYSHSPFALDDEEEQWQLAYKTDKIKADPDKQRSDLDFFKSATLTIAGKTYTAKPVVDGPYRDNFTLPSGEATSRNLGVVFYTFDVKNLPPRGAFAFNFEDSRGKAYSIKSDLNSYR
ncbi:hypothetical protein [Deinococcus frigens]|uniref:hypothetical protein n=1 Tax=Deinococcus frigens TaxID=249403 RepID=UPI000496716F|nr:hypothetical protein [Deinococcus frigens]